MPLLPHETLNDRYRIISLLAEGAYGAVYRAWDLRAEKECAIKEYLDSSGQVQRAFRAEARRLSRLKHEGLPEILDHFALDDVGQYLVMEYIDGVSLQELLDQYGPLPSDLIILWLQDASAILNYIHEQEQLHLNVKPANIRVTPAGQVYLVDTGLPGLGIPPGNSGYAAPEQQKQQTISRQSDIYSLGATLYTLLTNQKPPDGLRRESGLAELKSAREINPDSEPYLSLVANRAMDLRPDVRYETAIEFANALNRPSGRTIYQPDGPRRTDNALYGRLPPPKQPVQRRRQIELRTIGGLLFLIIFFTGLIAGYFYANRPETLPGGSEVNATATFQSQVIAAITAIASPDPPTPTPTLFPTATPSPIENETGSRMLYVPGGVFRMGNDEGENNERPSHLAVLEAYYIDETEVTNGEYKACVSDGACVEPDRLTASYHPVYYSSSEYDNYPVIFVNWDKANAFCEWRGARLPTEAEWERAAGFDPIEFERTLYPWGDNFNGTLLNYCDVNCAQEWRDAQFDDGNQDTAPVGSYPDGRSPIGALDMLGNVMEWVADWYDAGYYDEASELNPLGPLDGEARVIRGGSWFSRGDVTITTRGSFVPEVSRANLGFRCAMDIP
ncbi:MAG: SUMF1/EgtB/PvdO family nonheme iron enzyme [Anaerolineales bacterium]|nr:SUMF1/EgtB/PvdO family nonheme iron enzyme [Anaerolineales bacterium]MCB0012478.1 SUMF1/EgtB/PvdO family nonheme iron enzyme [Anaerolineales bacterium]MCB8958739.1 SUMF1/EgtB/PvdO family nonheme iron enzyme [Ardenticatenales bacterium]